MTTDLLPAPLAGAVLDADVLDGYDSPVERASARREDLRRSFAESLLTVAKMYRDEDWRYLTKDDGSRYSGLTEMLAEDLHLSVAMARRYVQGARDFTLPLMEMVVDGTRIEVTSGDVATLGSDGLHQAVETARTNLARVTDPEQASGIIDEALQEARDAKADRNTSATLGQERRSTTEAEDADWDNAADVGSGIDLTQGGPVAVDPFADPSDLEDFDPRAGAPTAPPAAASRFEEMTDPIAMVLADGTVYDTPAALAEIEDEELRQVAAAIALLASIDPSALAKQVDFNTRGILLPVSDAVENVEVFRSTAETQPWLLHRLGGDD